MVVSAILTTALAPITGALFGASYGTSIRIGYEIIFPALFGDMINDQKNNPTKLQEEGSKKTIQAMHKMFQGVGGAAAMEFGIEQGIELAKKKTESSDVQSMIDLSLGLTDRQLNKRGKASQFQDTLKESESEKQSIKEKVQKFNKGGDFLGLSTDQIVKVFEDAPHNQLKQMYQLFLKEKHNNVRKLIIEQLVRRLLKEKQPDTPGEAIEKSATGIVKQIAILYNKVVVAAKKYRLFNTPRRKGSRDWNRALTSMLTIAQTYNRFVQSNRKPKLTIDTNRLRKFGTIAPK